MGFTSKGITLASMCLMIFLLVTCADRQAMAAVELVNPQQFDGHTYAYCDLGMTWEEAESYCEQMGGHLVTITSPVEQAIVEELVLDGTRNCYWLGARKSGSASFSWITNEIFSYSKWAYGEPNNYNGSENALLIYRISNPANLASSGIGSWNDLKSDGSLDSYDAQFFGKENIGFIFEANQPVDILSGLVAHYEFEGNANDSSGNNHNGVENGGIQYTAGAIGQGASFDGAMEENIQVNNFPDITGSISISAWVKPNQLDLAFGENNPIVSKGVNGEPYAMWVGYNSISILLNFGSSEAWFYGNINRISDNYFYHVVSIYDSLNKQVSVFLNGTKIDELYYDAPLYSNNEPLYISSSYPGAPEFFKGVIDDVRIYDRALKDNDVKALFQMGNTGASLSGYAALQNIGKVDPSQRDNSSYIAEPLDSATGAHCLTNTLVSTEGAREIGFDISYNSLLNKKGPLGKAWNHQYEAWIETTESGNAVIHWNTNRHNNFVNDGSGTFSSNELAIRSDKLIRNPDGNYTLTLNDQSVYEFDSSGKLIELRDPNGRKLTLIHTGDLLTTIAEPTSGQCLTLNYNAENLISAVTDPLGRQTSFAYDASYNLISITDTASNTITYSYDSYGNVVSAVDSAGTTLFTDTYDDMGRVVAQQDAMSEHNQGTFSYDETTEPGHVITTYTDREGNINTYVHDSNYKLLSKTDGNGNEISFSYDDKGNKTSETDQNGNTTTYTYDERGNMLSSTDADGNETTMSYDDRNNLLSVTNALGHNTSFSYDSNNNLLSITDAEGNHTTYTYDANSQMASRTLPDQGTSHYS